MNTQEISKGQLWTGRIMSAIVILFMLMDGVMKFMATPEVIDITVNQLGYKEHHLPVMGVLSLGVTLLYLIPSTSLLGVVLMTGYFGGAVATHMRLDNPLFTHTLFSVYLGILAWVGLWLREPRLRNLFPVIKNS